DAVRQEMAAYFSGRFTKTNDDALASLADVLGRENAEGILAARDESVLTLLEELYWLVQKPQQLSILATGDPHATGAHAAVTISQARQWTDRFLVQAFKQKPDEIRAAIADVAMRRG